MARPKKSGLDYWTVDVDAIGDDKLVEVIAEHGAKDTWYVWTRLMTEIYRVGLCYRWGEKELRVFAHRIQEPPERVREIISSCVEARLFDRDILELTGYLTSKGIQKRYLFCCRGRKEIKIPRDVLLVEPPENMTVSFKDLSKVKERKEEEIRISSLETNISGSFLTEKYEETPKSVIIKQKNISEMQLSGKHKFEDNVLLDDEQIEEVEEYYESKGMEVEDLKFAIQELDKWYGNNPKARTADRDDAKELKGWPFDKALERRKRVISLSNVERRANGQ